MGIFGGLLDMMRVNDDDYDEDDDYLDDEYEDEPAPAKGLSILRGKKKEVVEDEEPAEKPRLFPAKKVTPVKKNSGLELALVKPTKFDDSKEVVDDLLNGKAVVLNMEGLGSDTAQRIIDFTSGATYSMNGKLQKIAAYIFIITPENVSLSGEFQDILTMGGMTTDVTGMNVRF